MSDDQKVLFVRIDPDVHALLQYIVAHDSSREKQKWSTPRAVERIIREAAIKRKISPFPIPSEMETATTAEPGKLASENDRSRRGR